MGGALLKGLRIGWGVKRAGARATLRGASDDDEVSIHQHVGSDVGGPSWIQRRRV